MIRESTKVHEKYSGKLKEEFYLLGGVKEVFFRVCAGNYRESRDLGQGMLDPACLTVALDLIPRQQRSRSFLSSSIVLHLRTLRP